MLYAQLNELDKAQVDYEALYSGKTTFTLEVEKGLADVYFRQKKFRDAARHYRNLLAKVPEDSPDYRFIKERLKEID